MRLTILALCCSLAASLALGAEIVSQPKFIPDSGDHGYYSTEDQSLGASDPDRAIDFDNFTLAKPVDLTGVDWSGLWAEPLPGALSDVDFVVEIWNDDGGVPDLDSGSILRKVYEGGNTIGQSGPDMTVVGNTDITPSTPTTPGGGPGANYSGALPGVTAGSFTGSTSLAAGNYWISIIASQTFLNPAPVVDPEWQWALGSGPMDGFYSSDLTNDPPSTPAYGILQENADLAFTLYGEVVPEPTGLAVSLLGLIGAACFGRRRRP